jgi:hypothetical protein
VAHATFNYFIINTPPEDLLRTFAMVWITLVALLGMLEYVKRIHPRIVQYVQ